MVVTAAFVGGMGVHLSCSAQVKPRIKGMSDEWNTQHARRVRVCALPGMHVPSLGIQTLLHFPCASLHLPLFPTGQKKVLARSCFYCSVKVGLFKTLCFILRFAVARHFTHTHTHTHTLSLSLSCKKQRKKCMIHTMH